MTVVHLVERNPRVETRDLINALVPPPLFAQVSFDSYQPDPAEPTQTAALTALRAFAERVSSPAPERRWWRRSPAPPEGRAGLYLDGGFGVGKTHLLASLWHAVPEPKVFGTFVELTHLIGALGFARAASELSEQRLLCIDEFELDDPGDTVLVATLLQRLADEGVMLAATSNTLPGRLGDDRFAAADFMREIQSLSNHFDVLRIDGEDYRHRDGHITEPATDAELVVAENSGQVVAVDDFGHLLARLEQLHPSKYGRLVDGVEAVVWRGVRTIDDEAVALRLVVLVDRLYDQDVTVLASGQPLSDIFSEQMLRGGYRKKYFRALSRLTAMAQGLQNRP